LFAASQRRWREFAAILAVLILFAIGMALHAHEVAAARLPEDLSSPCARRRLPGRRWCLG